MKILQRLITVGVFFACAACSRSNSQLSQPATQPADLKAEVSVPFRFVAYGDSRFHDPKDTEAANPAVRRALVDAIAQVHPAFICFGGDIVYNGFDTNDWNVYDRETTVWRDDKIPVYPALGNHDLHGDEKVALGNYFQRFPDLKNSRYYSVRAANILMLVLDSSVDEVSGAQGQWLNTKLDNLPADVEFVFVVLHHPPYTSSSDAKKFGGGHSARSSEQMLAKALEDRQQHSRVRYVVFSGHVHNYERHEHGGVVYFVSGGAGAHAYRIERAPDDLFKSNEINYHYLLVEADHEKLTVTMNRIELANGKAVWSEPDKVSIALGRAAVAKAGAGK